MTREEAIAEVDRKRQAEPTQTWIASRRDDGWVVARVGVRPSPKPTGTAEQPPPRAPHPAPESVAQRIVTQYGSGG